MKIQGINKKMINNLKSGDIIRFYNGVKLTVNTIDNTDIGLCKNDVAIVYSPNNQEMGRFNLANIHTPEDLSNNIENVINNYVELMRLNLMKLEVRR